MAIQLAKQELEIQTLRKRNAKQSDYIDRLKTYYNRQVTNLTPRPERTVNPKKRQSKIDIADQESAAKEINACIPCLKADLVKFFHPQHYECTEADRLQRAKNLLYKPYAINP